MSIGESMVDSQVIAFTFVAAVLTLTPGADTMLVVRNVLRGGRHDGVVTTFGICAGLFMHAMLSALGVSVILMHSATAFHSVKFAGACYLVWLGGQALYSAVRGERHPAGSEHRVATDAVSWQRCFLEGLLSNVLNPKVAMFYLAFLPQFIGPTDPVLQKSLLLAGIHYAEGILWLVAVSMVVDQTRRFFLRSRVRRWLDGVCGTLLIGFGVRLALERQ
jgi:RhtB (resistance to homoserine/threonine) family protein